MSPNVTRRRLIQGVGALGVAGVAGNALVSANDGSRAVQEDEAALRVAHASPDTPSVAVALESVDDATGTADDGDGTGTATEDGDEPLIEGLQFSDVSDYSELDPGTYQLQITATENTGFLEGIFSEEEEQVIYDEEVELEGGTTYTAVAYGKLAEAGLGDTSTETDTPGIGEETETDDGAGVTTDEADTPTDSDESGNDDGVLGGETETDAGGTDGDQVVVDSLEYGDAETFELEAGEYTLGFRETSASGDSVGEETETDDGVGAGTETETDSAGIGDETETDATGSEQESRAFEVAVLEDDVSAPGDDSGDTVDAETPGETDTETADGMIGQGNETGTESPVGQETETDAGSDMTRIRVFHAVLDVDALEITAVESGDGGGLFGGGGDDGNETETATEAGGGVGGETETETDGGVGAETETPTAEETDGESTVQEAGISPEGGAVYSGFAMGYFYPEMVDREGTPTDDGATSEETETADGGVGAGTETPTGTAEGDSVAEEDAAEEFQFVTVEDAIDGERSDGGSDDGGILPDQSAPEAASD
ncbi:DUF4397 domain-containing protein [Halosimplex sp. J119]